MLRLFKHRAQPEGETKLCGELDFAATEAYKLLRTNLLFTLPDTEKCKVIGVTSSVRGEGKSTTAINLSYALAATGKQVLLIDGDLRLPTVAKKLKISAEAGLSTVLLDLGEFEASLFVMPNGTNWHVLPAGRIPPNPTELLGSSQMAKLIKMVQDRYDFVILDLPPVNIVSDALVASPLLDGVIMVVRQDFSTRREVGRCEKQLALSGVKVLGFVMSGVDNGSSRYKYRYRYKSKRYGYDKYSYQKAPEDAAATEAAEGEATV